MQSLFIKSVRTLAVLTLLSVNVRLPAYSQTAIVHQITLGTGQSWCEDSKINRLLEEVNALRTKNGIPTLRMDTRGMKAAEIRATQFAAYMATHEPGSPGFNPHEGWDTTAASVGYKAVTENLAYMSSDPAYIVQVLWQDRLHLNAILTANANVAGVSCIYWGGVPFWTYEPGYCSGDACGLPTPPSTTDAQLDAEQWAFLDLINGYRVANGAPALKISAALQRASQWMSGDMAARNYAGHTDSLGRSSGTRIRAFGYQYSPWGENIAAGASGAQATFEQWRTACDPDASGTCTYAHRLNMLNPAFRVIGVGRAYGASSTYRWYWTTDFGGVVDQTIEPGGTPSPNPGAPSISSFTANPSAITAGQSTQLAWVTAGATSVAIDQGRGTVAGSGAITVSPAITTTYRITASNSAGSVTASVTVAVAATGADTQAPTAPSITTAVSPSPDRIQLAWTASTDNTGVTGYQIIRDGGLVGTVSVGTLSFTDSTVRSGVRYTYVVRAYDRAGNYSSSTPAAVVAATPAPGAGCPSPAVNAFTGCYYGNVTLTGQPVLARTDAAVNFDWRSRLPHASLTPGNFSVRWQGTFNFAAGSHTFVATASDGLRIYLDGSVVMDRWFDQSAIRYSRTLDVTAGAHLITIEYYQRTGSAIAEVFWRSNAPAGQPPAIAAFTAVPTSIALGQSTVLSWSVANAVSVSINEGIGTVPASGSRTVSPAQATIYRLTATNSAGTTTATVTVSVNSMARDTQPPTAPVLVSGVAVSPARIDLEWRASQDNVGVAGYEIYRNTVLLKTVPGDTTTYSDITVSGGSAYTFLIKAYDSARNSSVASNAVQVATPPAAQNTGACPAPARGAFTGCFYNNKELSGNPVLVTADNRIDFRWSSGFPASAVTASPFSARWQGTFEFEEGTYNFDTLAADGVRLYIDGALVLDRWRDQPAYTFASRRTLSRGNHLVSLEYYSRRDSAVVRVSWRKIE